jgi:hypothetical protein
MRGLAVAPGGRLFAADIEEDQILEFNTATGAFTQVLDTPLNVHPCYWDAVGNRLITNGSFPVQAQEYPNGALPSAPLLDTTTGLGFHDYAVIDGDVYGASFATDTIVRIASPTSVNQVAFGTLDPVSLYVVSVSTGGRYDLDLDGDVDLDDAQIFFDCINGPNNPTVPPACTSVQFAKSDANADNDVDLEDVKAFTLEYSVVGP